MSKATEVSQIYFTLGLDTSGFTSQLNAAVDGVTKSSTKKLTSFSKSTSGMFAGIGKKIAAGLGVAAVGAFTKSCMDLGSNLAEVQNVVDTAFGDMSGYADQWASNAMTNFGLSETVAKKYLGVFGQMSSAMGVTGKSALDMAESVTGLTGDVASFYNLSTDEAYTKLKSIWTGETESLKDLGVIMTQTNLDQYALDEGLGKTTASMTEQEKLLLRFQYVTDSLSNASGDFIKTQDSWANQTRVLTLRFEQFKATLGKGFIALFTPIVKGINTTLIGLQKLADGFTTFVMALTGVDITSSTGVMASDLVSIGDDALSTAGNVSGIGDAAADTAKQIERSLAGFDKINKISEPESSSSSGTTGGTSSGGSGVTQETTSAATAITDFSKQIQDVLNPLKAISFDNLISSFGKLKKAAEPLTDKLFEGLSWAYYNLFVPLAAWTIQDLLPNFIDLLTGVLNVLNSTLDALKPLWQWAWNSFLQPIAEWTGGVIIDILNGLTVALYGVSDWINNNQGTFDTMIITLGVFAAAWKGIELAEFIMNAGGVTGIIKKLTDGIKKCTVEKVKDKIETAKICALYAKDFALSVKASIKSIYEQIKAFGRLQIAKTKDKIETAKICAVHAKDFVVSLAGSIKTMALSTATWIKDTAAKIAGTAATVAHTAATTAAIAATWLFNTALTVLTSPITLVIAALVALGVGIYELIKHWDDVKKVAGLCWDFIVNCWNGAGQWFTNLFSSAASGIRSAFSGVSGFFSDIWTGICNTFGNVAGWFRDTFSEAWQAVKDVFSTGGQIFDGIKDGILSGLKFVINALIGGINKVIRIPFNGINDALNGIKNVNIMGIKPFDWIPNIGVPQIPMLAEGGYVKANTPQLAMIGDNRHQGEVVAPEDKLRAMAQEAALMSSGGTLMAEAIAILKDILKVIKALDLDIQIDGMSLKNYIVNKINDNTKSTGQCEIIT
ncbi:MAG: hypothetical protein Q4F11_06050 [Eubacteriales bacterium]|nr:hypothetical protein [Eubacteriales bacterium]